jgi:DNA-binding XRE family transcriptional regulator
MEEPRMNPLKYYRIKAHMTQEQLALAANVQLTTIQKIERNSTNIAGIRLETAYNLATALGIYTEDLLFVPEGEE